MLQVRLRVLEEHVSSSSSTFSIEKIKIDKMKCQLSSLVEKPLECDCNSVNLSLCAHLLFLAIYYAPTTQLRIQERVQLERQLRKKMKHYLVCYLVVNNFFFSSTVLCSVYRDHRDNNVHNTTLQCYSKVQKSP